MNTVGILLEQMGMFVIYIIAGILLIKTHVLNRENLEVISRFVIRLALPMMIFINTVDGVQKRTLFDSLPILGIAAFMYICLLVLGRISGKILHLEENRRKLYQAMSMFGNIGFMGIPVVASIYPEKGILYISVFTIIDQLMLWTLGVQLTSPAKKDHSAFNPGKLINPVTAAVFLALVCVMGEIQIPTVVDTAFQKIGATATPLAMIYLGGIFVCIDVWNYIKKLDYYGIVVIKMILFPIFFYWILGFLPVSQEIHVTMGLISAMPVMSSVVMMANAAGSDGDYAMGGILVTTVCSIVTLPFVYWVFQMM